MTQSISKEFTSVGEGFPLLASDGDTVSAELPAGCSLRRDGIPVEGTPPFTHTGAPATYRVDCDAYEGAPKTATLDIA